MIRPATTNDIERIATIWEKAVGDTHDFLSNDDFAYYRSRIHSYFNELELYVAEHDGLVEGFIGIAGSMVEMLFVALRGRGLGRRLLDFAVAEKGINKVDVNEQNTSAVDFYRRYGFGTAGRSELDAEGRSYPILHMQLG